MTAGACEMLRNSIFGLPIRQLHHCKSAVAVGGGFDLFYYAFVVGDEVDGTEEVGGILRDDAGVFAFRGEIYGIDNALYFARIGGSQELLL